MNMDKDKSQVHGGGFSQSWEGFGLKSETSPSLPPIPPHSMGSSDTGRFSHDLSRMHDNPPKNRGHRRAHSEILTLPDDLSFDSDLGVVGTGDGPSFSDDTEEDLLSMYLDMDMFNSASSVMSAFQEGEQSSAPSSGAMVSGTALVSGAGYNNSLDRGTGPSERTRVRHQHSQSMDGSISIKPEMLMSGLEDPSAHSKKDAAAAKLAELALIDPKRAKRIWANRQSAARSKERKMRYIAELERKVQTLQTEATSLSAQLTLLQRDTTGLSAENSELKLRLQTTEQQVHLQDALNDALKEEIQHLKVLTGQGLPNGGPMMNFSPYGSGQQQQQFYPNNQTMHTLLAAQQFQQLQIHSQKQQHHFQQQQHLHQLQQEQQQLRASMASSAHKDSNASPDNPSPMKD